MSKYLDPKEVLPLEWHLYKTVCPVLAPIAYEQIGLTPNGITTVGNIFGALGLISLYNDNYLWFFLFIMIRQMLDALDGYVARKYKHFSKWGERYDHVSDALLGLLVALLFLIKLKPKNRVFIIPYILFNILIHDTKKKRSLCFRGKLENCIEPESRSKYMSKTRFLSYSERKAARLLFIIIILKYFNK